MTETQAPEPARPGTSVTPSSPSACLHRHPVTQAELANDLTPSCCARGWVQAGQLAQSSASPSAAPEAWGDTRVGH